MIAMHHNTKQHKTTQSKTPIRGKRSAGGLIRLMDRRFCFRRIYRTFDYRSRVPAGLPRASVAHAFSEIGQMAVFGMLMPLRRAFEAYPRGRACLASGSQSQCLPVFQVPFQIGLAHFVHPGHAFWGKAKRFSQGILG